MQSKTQVHWHGLDRSEALEGFILDRVRALDGLDSSLIVAKVTIELPHRHQTSGRVFHVKLQLDYPGHEIVITHDPSTTARAGAALEDPEVAVRDAFTTAKRQVKEWGDKRRRGARRPSA